MPVSILIGLLTFIAVAVEPMTPSDQVIHFTWAEIVPSRTSCLHP